MIKKGFVLATVLAAAPVLAQDTDPICQREVVVLGAGQDAGAPQIGNSGDTGPRLLPSSLGLIDRAAGTRYLFDATPAITQQLAMLDAIEPPKNGLGIDGIFLTHAHIGHYMGLAYLGREAAGAKNVPVYARWRMAEFLRNNGPWSQLVELGNIDLVRFRRDANLELYEGFSIWTMPVPHRDEYSETVGYVIYVQDKKVLYFPDFDYWPDFEAYAAAGYTLESEEKAKGFMQMLAVLAQIDNADLVFVDATFYNDNELPGRDMSQIPHPRVTQTMKVLKDLPAEQRAKVNFIHYNHTNPIRDPKSPQSKEVEAKGFKIARRGHRFCMDQAS